jgi:hypothetical protein
MKTTQTEIVDGEWTNVVSLSERRQIRANLVRWAAQDQARQATPTDPFEIFEAK